MKEIIDLLVIQKYYGVSREIDTAKGLYKIPYNYSELKDKVVRIIKSKKWPKIQKNTK
jgi:hypothetical protein